MAPKRTRTLPPRIWLAFPLALYLLVPTRNFYWDGLTFAINIEKNWPLRELLSPSHLIYPAFGLVLFKAALALGVKTRALFLLQTVNAVLAGACVPLVDRALRRRGASSEIAVAGALVFAFAATWWKFATDCDAYVPAIFLVLCANDLLESERSPVLAGLAHAAAMLFHQLALFYLVVGLMRRRSAAYFAAAILPAAVGFLWAYRVVSGGWQLAGFPAWLTTHSPDAKFSFAVPANLGYTLRGTLRLFFGGKITSPWVLAGVVAGMVLVWRLSRLPSGKGEWRDRKADFVWAGIYVAFLFFWLPQNTFYRMFYLAPAILLGASYLPLLSLRLLCTALFLWNAAFVIYPQSRVENNVVLRFAEEQHDRWPAGTPIAFHIFHPDLWTISYFNPQVSWIGLTTPDIELLESTRADAERRGQPIWLEATAYDLVTAGEPGRNWLKAHPVTHLVHFKDPKHEFQFYEVR